MYKKLTALQKEVINNMVNEHNWLVNRYPEYDERFSAIYIQADDMACDLQMNKEDFWNIYFN